MSNYRGIVIQQPIFIISLTYAHTVSPTQCVPVLLQYKLHSKEIFRFEESQRKTHVKELRNFLYVFGHIKITFVACYANTVVLLSRSSPRFLSCSCSAAMPHFASLASESSYHLQ